MADFKKIFFARAFAWCFLLCPVLVLGQTTALSDKSDIAAFQRNIQALEAGKLEVAERGFRALLRRYPKSIAVLNNLAATLTRQGRDDEAIVLLRRALESDRKIFTTYRNLTTLYEHKAALAYSNALNVRAKLPMKTNLRVVKQMDLPAQESGRASGENVNPPQTKTEVDAVVNAAEVDRPYVTDPDRETDDAPAVDSKMTPPRPADAGDVSGVPNAIPKPPAKTAMDSKKTEDDSDRDETMIIAALERWANAWSNQDVSVYYASYVDGHAPKDMTHQDWKDWRAERLMAPQFIEVTLDELLVTLLKDGVADVEFIQNYHSNLLKSKIFKRLRMVRKADTWKIAQERTLRRIK